ncbi:hypothetical protein JHK82_039529 [Glycine max]|nr:hypothetical protein JHK82_039529 [Glycine max]
MSFEPAPVGNGLSKDDKAKKLALQHWLEAISHTLDHTNDLKLFNMPPLPPQKIVKIAACLLRESNLRYGLQTHLEGAQRSTRKNFKPARHPDATNADDHDEGHNFINIEEEEQEIDQAEIDETRIKFGRSSLEDKKTGKIIGHDAYVNRESSAFVGYSGFNPFEQVFRDYVMT